MSDFVQLFDGHGHDTAHWVWLGNERAACGKPVSGMRNFMRHITQHSCGNCAAARFGPICPISPTILEGSK